MTMATAIPMVRVGTSMGMAWTRPWFHRGRIPWRTQLESTAMETLIMIMEPGPICMGERDITTLLDRLLRIHPSRRTA